jgi:OOP family OmpA-OmpF porin
MNLPRLAMFALALALTVSPALADDDDESKGPDEAGCRDSVLLTRFKGCRLSECSAKEFDAAELTVRAPSEDNATRTIEGEIEERRYVCPIKTSPLQIMRNAEAALKQGGYTIAWSGKDYGEQLVTGNKGEVWIQLRTEGWNNNPGYRLVTAREKAMTQEMTTADALAEELERSGRVAIYGINFDTGKATLQAGSEKVLTEIATLLGNEKSLKLRIEGHTDNVGQKTANQTLSQQRAAAVVAWLTKQGIAKDRLAPQGFGDTKPVADNDTEEGRAKNRRVELVRQ